MWVLIKLFEYITIIIINSRFELYLNQPTISAWIYHLRTCLQKKQCLQKISAVKYLAEKHLEKNSFFDEEVDDSQDFEFNQDFEIEEGTRSPGWIRYQKRIKWTKK